jgi:hypothetical protein
MGALDGSAAIPFWGFMREEIIQENPGIIDPDSTAYSVGHWLGEKVAIATTLFIPGPKGPAAAPGTVTLYAKTPAPIASIAMSRVSPPTPSARVGPITMVAESEVALQAAARVDAAAAAAARADYTAYTQIVGAQRETLLRGYEALGITPNSRMVGDIMKNAIERADAIWTQTRGTRPPGG